VYYGDAGFIRENLKPERISVLANTPNPFSEYTRISFALPQSLNNYQVDVLIFDINGKQVAQLGGKTYESGFYQLEWDGTNGFGKRLPSGVYIARTHINSSRVSQAYTLKMILQ
jgi:flagellar hook assembly protein FlgD